MRKTALILALAIAVPAWAQDKPAEKPSDKPSEAQAAPAQEAAKAAGLPIEVLNYDVTVETANGRTRAGPRGAAFRPRRAGHPLSARG